MMRCLLFIISLSFCSTEFAQITQHDSLVIPTNLNQDTLVSNSGEIIIGNIVEQADGYVSYRVPLSEEINLVAVDQLLLIKKANKPAEVLYKNDTLITNIGIFISCKSFRFLLIPFVFFNIMDSLNLQSKLIKTLYF